MQNMICLWLSRLRRSVCGAICSSSSCYKCHCGLLALLPPGTSCWTRCWGWRWEWCKKWESTRINQHQPALFSINQHINQQSISGTGWVGLEISAHIKERLNSVRPWLGGSVINKILLHYWKEGKTTVSRRVQRPLAKSLLGSSGRWMLGIKGGQWT